MYDELHQHLFEIVTFFGRSRQDKLLLEKAGVTLDGALFPLLMRVAHHEMFAQGLGIVELAEQVNRDYTTVSRQINRLVSLGLVAVKPEAKDKRIHTIQLTAEGKKTAKKIISMRQQLMQQALRGWNEHEIHELQRSLAHLSETIRRYDAG